MPVEDFALFFLGVVAGMIVLFIWSGYDTDYVSKKINEFETRINALKKDFAESEKRVEELQAKAYALQDEVNGYAGE